MNFPYLAQSGVTLQFNENILLKKESESELELYKNLNPNVVVLILFPGITENVVTSILSIPKLKGVILQTYGAGNAPTKNGLIQLLKKAIDNNILVVNVSQCLEGKVNMGLYETSSDLKRIGVINGKNITLESAIAKMMYLLGKDLSDKDFKQNFETSLRGEID